MNQAVGLPAAQRRIAAARHWLAALVAVPCLGAGLPPAQGYHEYSDWIAVCDNARSCRAKSVVDLNAAKDPVRSGAALSISRDAGPAAAPIMTVTSDGDADPAAVTIDGQPLGATLAWRKTDDGRAATLTGDAALAILRQLATANQVEVTAPDASMQPISLKGLSASLLLFDDVQGRLGNATAIIRVGPAPAEAVPPAPALPVLRAAAKPPALKNGNTLIAAVRRGESAALSAHDCDAGAGPLDDAEPLTPDEALVILVCAKAAYQETYLIFRLPRASPAAARLMHPPTAPGAPRPINGDDGAELMGVSYEPATGALHALSKGRGLADCGTGQDWVFDGQNFVPATYTMQVRCGGEAGDWPTIYRTDIRTQR